MNNMLTDFLHVFADTLRENSSKRLHRANVQTVTNINALTWKNSSIAFFRFSFFFVGNLLSNFLTTTAMSSSNLYLNWNMFF